MTGKNCELEIKESEGVLEVTLMGEIDHHGAVSVRSRIDARISETQPKKTVIDLSGIDFMDSSGLGLIMGRYALMQKTGGTLSVKNPNERIIKIFEMAGLDKIVEIEGVKPIQKSAPSKKRKKSKKAKEIKDKNETKGK